MRRSVIMLAGRLSGLGAAANLGVFMDAEGYVVESATTSTAFAGAPVSCAALGLVGTPQSFAIVVPYQTTLAAFQILLRVPWVLTTQSADAAARATVRVTLTIAGVDVVTAEGLPRALNAANGTRYAEILALAMTTAQVLPAGTSIRITVQPVVTTAGAGGSTYLPTLEHNPQSPDSQLVAEFQGAA